MQDAGKEWALEVEDLTVAYDDQPVLWDVDLQVPAGVKMAIIGPNGGRQEHPGQGDHGPGSAGGRRSAHLRTATGKRARTDRLRPPASHSVLGFSNRRS